MRRELFVAIVCAQLMQYMFLQVLALAHHHLLGTLRFIKHSLQLIEWKYAVVTPLESVFLSRPHRLLRYHLN